MDKKIALIAGSFVLSIVCATFNTTSALNESPVSSNIDNTYTPLSDDSEIMPTTNDGNNANAERQGQHHKKKHKSKNKHHHKKHGSNSHKNRTNNDMPIAE